MLKSSIAELESWLSDMSPEEVKQLTAALNKQTEKVKQFWKLRCEQMLAHNEIKGIEDSVFVCTATTTRAPEARLTDSAAIAETTQCDRLNAYFLKTS